MNPIRVDWTSVAPQRWRNGGGVTRELLALPNGGDWTVRISVADIERDGDFSAYPGVTRWFGVLTGKGVELLVNGCRRQITPSDEPICFSGAARSSCRLLDGPTRDLNLMLRDVPGSMQLAQFDQTFEPSMPSCGLFVSRAVRCRYLQEPQGAATMLSLPAMSLVWFDRAPAELQLGAAEADAAPGTPLGFWMVAATE